MIKVYDRGSTPMIEVEFKQYMAFGSYAYFTPSASDITIYQPGETPKFDGVALTPSGTTGKYYYKCQTATTWEIGDYWAKVTASDGTNTDVQDKKIFRLE